MSFKMDFINKMADQVKGWFNQKPSSTSSAPTTSTITSNSVSITRPNTSPATTSITPSTPKNSIRNTNFHLNLNNSSHQPSLRPSNIVNNNYNYNNNNNSNHNNNNNSNIKFNKSPNEHCPINYHHQQHTQHHHQVLPPTSLSLSNWSSASPGTPSSGGSIASANSSNIASSSSITSPFNNFAPQQHHHHHPHHQFPQHSHHQNQYHHQSHHQVSSHHYTQQQTKQHSLEHSQQQQLYGGSNNCNNPSSSSSSTSFGPLTPSPFNNNNRNNNNDTSIGLGPRSYSAITTPDSPGNFRRQLSLNVRNQTNFRPLPLDFKSQKKSPIYAKQSASTDLIDKHSLSPRPRPKDLSLSSSQDNMLKGCFNNPMDGSSHHHPPPPFTNTRPDYLTMNSTQPNNVGGSSTSHQPIASVYQIRLPPKFSYSLTIDGKDYKNLKESDFIKLEQLGAGNFGQVDKMLHIQSNTKLAVKKMRRSGNIDDNRHVQRDLELLLKCNYKHVVQCYGFLILETEVWIFMELMATCFDRLIQKLAEINETVPERIIGKVAVATIDALHYLKEEHNGIHRDIKPSNILINDRGIIKLCDFGISGNLINSKAHSRSKGSTPYIAPERIEPPPDGTYDIRSDIWSMGITLVEIATGRFPYQNWNTDFEILSKVIQEEPPELPEDRDFSDDFRKFINACLIKNSEHRPKYKELMNYPFYKKYKIADVDVAQWFKQAYYCDTSSSRNNNFECNNEIMDNRSNSSSASSLASNSTIK